MEAEGYELASLIDLDRVQRLCESLSQAFDFALAVLDLSGNVLIATGWQDICTRFHRENADTLSGCLESDLRINRRLAQGLDPSEHYAYRCSNGLWDVAFPLVVAGEHVANVYTGQFFFDDDDVDRAEFARRARRLGFDEQAYLAALDRVPVISHERLQKTVRFLADFVGMLGEMGVAALQERRKHAQLVESEERYHRLFDNATEGLTVFRVERGPGGEVEDVVVVDLNPIQAERTRVTRAQLIGRRLSECDGHDERLRAYFDVVRGAAEARCATRSEACLHARDAYELLSAYPAGDEDLWVLSATDVTDLREAEQALHRQDEAIRTAYVDVLDAVTGGKLILLTEEQLPEELGTTARPAVRLRRAVGARGGSRHDRARGGDLLPRPDPPQRSAEHRGRGARQRGQARGRRHVPGLLPRREPAGRDHRRRPGDRLQDPAPGHARARLLHRGEPRHGLHHHAAALRAGAAVHATRAHGGGARDRAGRSRAGATGSRDRGLAAARGLGAGGRLRVAGRSPRAARPPASPACRRTSRRPPRRTRARASGPGRW